MIIKIFLMFSRYIQIYLLYLLLHSSYTSRFVGWFMFFLSFDLSIWPYHLALPFGLTIWPYPNIFYVFLSIAPWNGDIQKCIYIVFLYNPWFTIYTVPPRTKAALSPCTKTSLPLVILPVILLYNSAKLQYFLQYLAVEFQYCRIRVERWSITVRMGIV